MIQPWLTMVNSMVNHSWLWLTMVHYMVKPYPKHGSTMVLFGSVVAINPLLYYWLLTLLQYLSRAVVIHLLVYAAIAGYVLY